MLSLTPSDARAASQGRADRGGGAPLIRALGATYRWRVDGLRALRSDRRVGQASRSSRSGTGASCRPRSSGKTAASSSSPARTSTASGLRGIIRRFGYGTARGSTSRGGARALVQLRRDLAAGRPAAFTVDGPRGPARVAQPGAVFLAGATGHPSCRFTSRPSRSWTMSSWDRTRCRSRSAASRSPSASRCSSPTPPKTTIEGAASRARADRLGWRRLAKRRSGRRSRSEFSRNHMLLISIAALRGAHARRRVIPSGPERAEVFDAGRGRVARSRGARRRAAPRDARGAGARARRGPSRCDRGGARPRGDARRRHLHLARVV